HRPSTATRARRVKSGPPRRTAPRARPSGRASRSGRSGRVVRPETVRTSTQTLLALVATRRPCGFRGARTDAPAAKPGDAGRVTPTRARPGAGRLERRALAEDESGRCPSGLPIERGGADRFGAIGGNT